jgi:DNA ligase 1
MENLNPKVKNELGLSKRSSHKANKRGKGRVGALLGLDVKTGQSVRVGSGFTAKQRDDLWMLWKKGGLRGTIIKYKHFAQSGVKDKRRHTIFLGIRDEDDL